MHITTHRYDAFGFGVRREQGAILVPQADGSPALPEQAELTILMFDDFEGTRHEWVWTPDNKQRLIEMLTGGVVIAGNGDIPPLHG